ncbi:MAG TPA: hypothetical protein VID48_01485, partial [Solirubrobacteraceae bacterium]
IGSMISLGYYLPVLATMWMGEAAGEAESSPTPIAPPSGGSLPAIAGGSPELDLVTQPGARHTGKPQLEVLVLALLAGGATLFFGILPQPLFELVRHVGSGLGVF